MEGNTRTFYNIQVLRALGFMSIFLLHATVIDEVYSRWGVTLFLILSGFLNVLHYYNEINSSYRLNKNIKFGIKKIKKIYPLHLIMLIFAFLSALIHEGTILNIKQGEVLGKTIIRLVSNILLVSDWFPKYYMFSEYNIVTWFLSLILLYYIFTPFLIRGMKKAYQSKNLSAIWVMVFAYIISIVVGVYSEKLFVSSDIELWAVYESPISRIWDYFLGCQLGYLFMTRRKNVKDKKLFTIVGLSSIVVTIILFWIALCCLDKSLKWIANSGFYFTIPVLSLIYSMAILEDYIGTRVNTDIFYQVLVYLGGISSEAYLIHVPVINYVHAISKKTLGVNKFLWSVSSCLLTILFSIWAKKVLGKKLMRAEARGK